MEVLKLKASFYSSCLKCTAVGEFGCHDLNLIEGMDLCTLYMYQYKGMTVGSFVKNLTFIPMDQYDKSQNKSWHRHSQDYKPYAGLLAKSHFE